jgi:hypothetical protein
MRASLVLLLPALSAALILHPPTCGAPQTRPAFKRRIQSPLAVLAKSDGDQLTGKWDYMGNRDECMLNDTNEFESAADPALTMLSFALPILLPICGALSFETDVAAVHNFLEWLAQAKWVAVDGGLSRNAALLPVMTGIVLPCVSFALGTLTATTISTLRARQVELRTLLNTEACFIRNVLSACESMFSLEHSAEERYEAALLLRHYCTRVLLESRSGVDLNRLSRQGAANSELDGITRLLHHAAALPAESSYTPPRFYTTTEFLVQMYVEKLQLARSERLSLLQTTFPAVHWLALSMLGCSIMFAFLFAADQQTLLFLAPVQLRVLFSVLVGALTATACICADLNDPFRGAFQITPSSEQLLIIRDLLDESLCAEGDGGREEGGDEAQSRGTRSAAAPVGWRWRAPPPTPTTRGAGGPWA